MSRLLSKNVLRAEFAKRMSDMYEREVPAYRQMRDLVIGINKEAPFEERCAIEGGSLFGKEVRGTEQRHGAIRVGKAQELQHIRRLFALMGMEPVGYYDLSVAGIPVHSTAFRPLLPQDMVASPFRIFTSLLRVDLIEDEGLRARIEDILSKRQIMSDELLEMMEKAEKTGGISEDEMPDFMEEILKVFKWREEANVSGDLYQELLKAHGLVADIVSFKGPHINHLTPSCAAIDLAQRAMEESSLNAKLVIEGPPQRKCPILLRQTAFKALNEEVMFPSQDGRLVQGTHTARFGEIEARGAALTPKGRALYDETLEKVLATQAPKGDGSNLKEYKAALKKAFDVFPDDWDQLREEGLIYVRYEADVEKAQANNSQVDVSNVDQLIKAGFLKVYPQVYEDFLPVSAAGIFRSNLNEQQKQDVSHNPQQALFEKQLGAEVHDQFALYEKVQQESLSLALKGVSL